MTGSRDWDDAAAVHGALAALAAVHGGLTIVHGHCPTGADRLADEFGRANGHQVERHPADWARHGKRAGFLRNAEMVALGADVCLAFVRGGSRGASMTAGLAERAGIPTTRWERP